MISTADLSPAPEDNRYLFGRFLELVGETNRYGF